MENLITKNDIIQNSKYFWGFYFSYFRGGDDSKEISMDEVIDSIIDYNSDEHYKWIESFFKYQDNKPRYIGGKLNEQLSFHIEFVEEDNTRDIVFYINDEYIGNLGGHFECWSLTLNEILFFEQFDFVFLLLLPMVGISKEDFNFIKKKISKNLKLIPEFKKESNYIAECITKGLVMNGEFYNDENVGVVNNQNHSVRNIEKYPRYKDSVIRLNKILGSLNS